MAITTTTLADDSKKTIVKANGLGGETKELLLDASKLSGATASPNLSIAHIYYEILGTGNLTFFFDAETDEQVTTQFSDRGNYGLKKMNHELNKAIQVQPYQIRQVTYLYRLIVR